MRIQTIRTDKHPEHVPADLAFDFDFFMLPLEFGDSPQAYWKAVQDTYPALFWTPAHGGHWVATRGEDIKHFQADYEQFSSNEFVIPKGASPKVTPVQLDPPEHTPLRRLLNPFFSAKALVPVQERAREVAIEIIEQLKPRGECDFIAEFAGVMPVVTFMNVLGVPESDAAILREWAGWTNPATNPKAPEAWRNITAYVQEWINRRRAEPGDDLISAIVHAKFDGKPLDPEQVLSTCTLVVGGGLDTVVLVTSFTAHHLALNPQDRQFLREHPEKISDAVEEFLRRFSVSNLAREIRRDLVYKGVTMRKGELVLIPFPLVGLDDRINENPLKVDFNRSSFRHATFGTGPHNCIGAPLARREIAIFLEEWLARIPDFQIKRGTVPRFHNGILNSIENLHLEWAT